jgi:aquaporin NIP
MSMAIYGTLPQPGADRRESISTHRWNWLPSAGVPTPDLKRRAVTEALGTYVLVFAGCGAIVTDAERDGALGAVGIALVFFLVLVGLVSAGGHVSGAHYNPAVTIALTVARHFPLREAAAYVAAQIAGATAAALTLLAAWPDAPAELGATVPSVGAGSALLYELVMTAFLVFVIFGVATDTRAVGVVAALAIGAAVGCDALFGGPLTGASMNPARSFGPALAAGTWTDFWIYLAGPVAGGLAGGLVYEYVRRGGGARSSPP